MEIIDSFAMSNLLFILFFSFLTFFFPYMVIDNCLFVQSLIRSLFWFSSHTRDGGEG